MSKLTVDFSTLNLNELKKLGVYKKPPSYHVSDHMGSGCYLDVPGYPTYFIRSVYTASGNNPSKGTQEVIDYKGTFYALPDFWVGAKSWDDYSAKRNALLNRLYIPLPEDHPRVQAWIHATYTHLKNCYYDASAESKNDQTLIYPVPYYKLRTPRIDWVRWSVEYIMQHCAEIAAYNRMVIDHAMEVATIDNHKAVRAVREVYPDHVPYVGLRHNPKPTGNWYERLAERPTPYNCPGDSIGKHPVNGTWCQCCGWKAPTAFLIRPDHDRKGLEVLGAGLWDDSDPMLSELGLFDNFWAAFNAVVSIAAKRKQKSIEITFDN